MTLLMTLGAAPMRPDVRIVEPACVPAGLTFEGQGRFPADVRIEGTVRGSLAAARGTLMVGPSGAFHGEASAAHAHVAGIVTADLDCSAGAVEFAATARGSARLHCLHVSVERGAEIVAETRRVET